jgi:hypothetical protein
MCFCALYTLFLFLLPCTNVLVIGGPRWLVVRSETISAMDTMMTSLDLETVVDDEVDTKENADPEKNAADSGKAAAPAAAAASQNKAEKLLVAGAKKPAGVNPRKPRKVQTKKAPPTPAEVRRKEEADAAKKHEQGVKSITAVTKMSTRLVARRRALSQVEMQTNWIAKAVFSAAARKGPLALNLLGCNVNNSAAIRLATTLATSDIKSLNLTFNQIGDVGAKAIARALKATPALEELGLGSNLITDHGASDIAAGLEDEKSCLTFLNMSGNMIGDRGAAALGEMLEVNASLVEVCLDSNFIGVEGKDALSDGMYNNTSQSLEFVSLAGNVRSGLLYKQRDNSLVTRIIWKT